MNKQTAQLIDRHFYTAGDVWFFQHPWKLSARELADRNYNLDSKNPHEVEINHRDPEELMAEYQQILRQLMACLGGNA